MQRFIALAAGVVLLAVPTAIAQAPVTPDTNPPDCAGYEGLAKKAFNTQRWWQLADRTPASKGENRRLDTFVSAGCPAQVRLHEKEQYAAFYRKVIAPEVCGGQRWANCAVATCESGLGRGGNILYGFTVYWSAMSPLPVKGNGSGTRFAPSASAATKLEQDVVAAAAFRFGPTPGTCAS